MYLLLSRSAIAAMLFMASQFSLASPLLGEVAPDVIFGSGNANGGFTIVQEGSLELGLRAKLRFDEFGQPQNNFPWDGVDTYTFLMADGNAPANRALWNFEWSINTDWDEEGVNLDAYSYRINLAGPGGYSYDYDPFGALQSVSLGTNATVNGAGEARDFWDFLFGDAPDNRNVAQESENIGFSEFGNGDPQGLGQYSVTLSAMLGGNLAASNTIYVNVLSEPVAVSEPATLALLGLGLTGIATIRRRRLY